MKQKLDKTINAVDSAVTAFQSIQWPSVDTKTNLDALADKLSEITGIVMDCRYAVLEAGSNARSTGWYVDEELWGGVPSGDWHAAADLAESLEGRLDQIGDQTWNAYQEAIEIDDDLPDWRATADKFVTKIEKEASLDELVAAIRRLSFLNH